MTQVIYLAGGFRGGWQEYVIKKCKKHTFINPLSKELNEDGQRIPMTLKEFGTWDIHYIKHSDIIFVYSQNENPGVAYMMEAAYAKGLGKTVIAVIEKDNKKINDRYIAFMELFCDCVFYDIEEGIEYLNII